MKTKAVQHDIHRKGVAYLFALLLLALMTTLAVGMTSGVNLIIQRPENSQQSLSARLAAESGIAYLRYHVSQPLISPNATGGTLLQQIYGQLSDQLDTSPSATGGVVTFDTSANVVTVPGVQVDSDKWFGATITMVSDRVVRLTVTGHKTYRSSDITKVCSIDLEPFGRAGEIFKNGLVTRGPLIIKGNAYIQGQGPESNCDIVTTGLAIENIFELFGNGEIDGRVIVQNADQTIKLNGNTIIGDEFYHSQTITQQTINNDPEGYESVVIGTDPIEIPEIDPTVFEPFAVNIIDASTPTSGNYSFQNVRIKANTNPDFSGNVTIDGVCYIEQPNKVKFSGNLVVRGLIVTETAEPSSDNEIEFCGNLWLNSVDDLPDNGDFEELKQLRGSALLAPGFEMKFSGNVENVGGTMAAENFTFFGNADMTIDGGLISYGTDDLMFYGNVDFVFNNAETPDIPAGFVVPGQFGEVDNSYREY